jgi:hypothetical protein
MPGPPIQKEIVMNKRIALVLVGAALALAGGVAQAHSNVSWSVGVNLAPIGVGIGGPAYYPPAYAAPVYVQPAPVYVPAPVYYQPQPVYYQPGPVIYYGNGGRHYAPPRYYRPDGRGYRPDGRGWQGHR